MKKIVRTIAPCRINDIGGWTDTHFANYGAVQSIAVYPGVEVNIEETDGGGLLIELLNYKKIYSVFDVEFKAEHPLLYRVARYNFPPNLKHGKISIHSRMPPGAGTGTSAAAAVALLSAFRKFAGLGEDRKWAAVHAHYCETKMGIETGIQDQIAAAYGGIKYMKISPYPHFDVYNIRLQTEMWTELQTRLVLVYLGQPHDSAIVHEAVMKKLGKEASQCPTIEQLRQNAFLSAKALKQGDLKAYGQCMNRNTELQEKLHIYLINLEAAMLIELLTDMNLIDGAKVNGAGGDGGSVTFLAKANIAKRVELSHVLKTEGYQEIPTILARGGVQSWIY